MTEISIGVLIAFLIISCNTTENRSSIDKGQVKTKSPEIYSPEDSNYPEAIIKQGLENQYDEAKWNLYLYASIDSPRDTNGKLVFPVSKSYAAYPVMFDTLYQNVDTLIFYFNFYIEDSILSDQRIFSLHLNDVPNAVNVYGTKRCVYFKGKTGFDYNWICAELDPKKIPKDFSNFDTNMLKSISGRLYFPVNPLVVKYIVANQKELNPWFVNEARRRKVIR